MSDKIFFKDVLFHNLEGDIVSFSQRYTCYEEKEDEYMEEYFVTDVKDEVYYLTHYQILEVRVTQDRVEHLKNQLEFRLKELQAYSEKTERYIKTLEDREAIREARKSSAVEEECLINNVARAVRRLLTYDVDVEDEVALLCYNMWLSRQD